MLLQDMADYLTSGGLSMTTGTNLWGGIMKSDPDTAMALYEAGGLAPVYTMGDTAARSVLETVRMQVVSRSASYETARANAQQAYRLLDGMPKRVLNGTRYHWSRPVQPPFLLARDDASRRVLIAFNVDILKDLSTTS